MICSPEQGIAPLGASFYSSMKGVVTWELARWWED